MIHMADLRFERDPAAEEIARKSGVRFRFDQRLDGLWMASLAWVNEHVALTCVGKTPEDAAQKLSLACEDLDG